MSSGAHDRLCEGAFLCLHLATARWWPPLSCPYRWRHNGLVASYQPRLLDTPFQIWEVEVNKDKSALVTMVEDDGRPVKVSQTIPLTDFPLKNFSFYTIDRVMRLSSEY